MKECKICKGWEYLYLGIKNGKNIVKPCPKCKGDKTMTKFKAILGLVMLFLGGFIVFGLALWVGYNAWLDMAIRYIIR